MYVLRIVLNIKNAVGNPGFILIQIKARPVGFQAVCQLSVCSKTNYSTTKPVRPPDSEVLSARFIIHRFQPGSAPRRAAKPTLISFVGYLSKRSKSHFTILEYHVLLFPRHCGRRMLLTIEKIVNFFTYHFQTNSCHLATEV